MNFFIMIWNCYHFINKTSNLQGIKTIFKIHIYSKMINKKTCNVLEQL
jgi:hypothetical protein